MTNLQIWALIAAVGSVSLVEYNRECCNGRTRSEVQGGVRGDVQEDADDTVDQSRVDDVESADKILDFATLEPCTRQRITAVTYAQDGSVKHRSRLIWDGDHPGVESGDIVKLVGGWE